MKVERAEEENIRATYDVMTELQTTTRADVTFLNKASKKICQSNTETIIHKSIWS